MSIYQDIISAQVKQGNMGGKKGPLGYLAKEKKENYMNYKQKFIVKITKGKVFKSTDSNGLSDPWVRILKPGVINKTLCHTKVQEKTLEPVWNYTGSCKINFGGENTIDVIVELLDKDMVGNDRVGVGKITVGPFGESEKTMKLYDPKDSKQVTAEIVISLKPDDGTGESDMSRLDF